MVSPGGGNESIALDDRPVGIWMGRDGKRILVSLPYELWIVNTSTKEVERTIELTAPAPRPFEAEDGGVWIGGPHLFRASMFNVVATKIGTRLGGFVERVGLIRPSLLCGVGPTGEVLWDTEEEEALHRRRTSEREVTGLEVAPDGRAVFADGSSTAWIIDPDHPAGYKKLKLHGTSNANVPAEGVVALGTSTEGRCLLGARDGAVAWTNRALRLEGEVFPHMNGRRAPLDLTGDRRWIYVLRPGGVLQRFLLSQPEPTDEEPEPDPLPEAQQTRVERGPTTMVMAPGGTLWMAGGTDHSQLGRLWPTSVEALEWSNVRLGTRTLEDDAPPEGVRTPSFVTTRSKFTGRPLAEVKVDEVLSGDFPFLVTHGYGSLLERPVARVAPNKVLPGDTVLLPAMVRFHEGTARPAILMRPGSVHDDRPVDLSWLAWGDEPRGWVPLRTPEIRNQGWSRRAVFPLQVALPTAPPGLAGHRCSIPERWTDADLFAAMARECKKLLKVLW